MKRGWSNKGDGKGTEDEKEGNRHSPDPRSPPAVVAPMFIGWSKVDMSACLLACCVVARRYNGRCALSGGSDEESHSTDAHAQSQREHKPTVINSSLSLSLALS